jgi:hypothetical protein
MVKVVSVDCGSKNMGVCVMEVPCGGVVQGSCVTHLMQIALRGSTISDLVGSLKSALHEHAALWSGADIFIIEQQTSSNIRMKVISHCLQMYWHINHPQSTVQFSSAKGALDCICGSIGEAPTTKTYHARKARSVAFATMFLAQSNAAHVLATLPKKDDCADALMHAVSWYVRSGCNLHECMQSGGSMSIGRQLRVSGRPHRLREMAPIAEGTFDRGT